jgi:hypothetical protein
MALPASGQISMDDIRIELGVPTQTPFGLNEARSGTYQALNQFSPSLPPSSGQVSLSDWYSYCQNCGYNSGSFYYDASSAATACAGSPNTILYWTGSLAISTILYTDSLGTSEASQGYWSDGTNAYFQNCPDGCGDGITSITACSSPSYGLYTADEYYCDGNECVFSLANVVVAFELPFTPSYSKYYELQAGGFYYILSEEVFTGPGAICNPSPNFTDCATWCFV